MTIQSGTHIIHTVQPGDTVYRLAVRYESDVDRISQANGLYPPFMELNVIYPGQVLVIPRLFIDPTETLYVIQPGDSLTKLSQRFSAHWELLAGINHTIQNPNILFPNQQIQIPAFTYDVEMNDTLYSISQQTGVSVEEILLANTSRPSVSGDLIYKNIKIIIPTQSSRNIAILQPLPGMIVNNNSTLEGLARSYEANVLYRLIDQNEVEVIRETFTTALYAAPNFGRFIESMSFDTDPTASEGKLQVFTRSARDGSIQDLVQIKVFLQ